MVFSHADTVFFHLPPLSEDMKCVYGVSCYRQIEAKVSDDALSALLVTLLVLSPKFHPTCWIMCAGAEGAAGRRDQRDGAEERLRPQPSGERSGPILTTKLVSAHFLPSK